MDDEWITTIDASEIIGVTDHQIRKLIKQGKLDGKRFGRIWIVKKTSAEAYKGSYRKPGPKPE